MLTFDVKKISRLIAPLLIMGLALPFIYSEPFRNISNIAKEEINVSFNTNIDLSLLTYRYSFLETNVVKISSKIEKTSLYKEVSILLPEEQIKKYPNTKATITIGSKSFEKIFIKEVKDPQYLIKLPQKKLLGVTIPVVNLNTNFLFALIIGVLIFYQILYLLIPSITSQTIAFALWLWEDIEE